MEFDQYLHLQVTRELFAGVPAVLSADIVAAVIDWPSPFGQKEISCVQWLREFLAE